MNSPRSPEPAQPLQRSAWLNSSTKIVGTGITFLLYIALARTMTPEAFADFAVIFAWLAVAAALSTLSFPLVLVRVISESLSRGRADLARGVVQFSAALSAGLALVIASLGSAAVLLGVVELPRDMASSVLIAAALLTPSVALVFLAGLLTALKRAVAAELIVNVMRPALLVAGLATFWFLQSPQFTAPTVLALYLAASLVMVITGVSYALAILPAEMANARPKYEIRGWMTTAAGFMAVIVMVALSERIDLLLMGAIGLPAEVAVYAVAVRFAQTVTVAANAASTAMAPHLVERMVDLRAGRIDSLQALTRSTARTALYISLIALGGFWLLAPLFLSLFGPHYESAYAPLMVLTVGQVLSAMFGPAAAVATLAGAPRIAVTGLAAGLVVNITLNLSLVPTLGAMGAAVATATGMFCAAVIAWALTRRRFLLDSSVFGFANR